MTQRREGGSRVRGRATLTAVPTLLGPFAVLFACFFLAPSVYAVYSSLFGVKREGLYGAPQQVFVGLQNYATALGDPEFLASLRNIAMFGLGPTVVLIVSALAIALLIDARPSNRLTTFFRLSTFAPYAVPGVIAAILWGFLYGTSTSPVVKLLASWGIHLDLLAPDNVVWGVGNIAIWTYGGYNVLIFLAQLRTIDPALFEAARIDGASDWRIALRIKLPLLRPAIVMSVIFNIIGTLQLFTEPQTLRAVSSAITSGWTPTMLAYQAASTNNYTYAATVSVLIALGAGAASFFVLRLQTRRDTR